MWMTSYQLKNYQCGNKCFDTKQEAIDFAEKEKVNWRSLGPFKQDIGNIINYFEIALDK